MKAADKKELKHDAYADTVYSSYEWAKQHQAPLLIAGIAVVVVIVGVLLLINTRRQSQEYSLQLLSDAKKQAAKAMEALKPDSKPEEKIAAAKEPLKQLETISREYADTDAGRRALLLAAQISTDVGQSAQAAGYYERALNAAGGDEGLANLARRGLAATLEDTGKTREALKHYQALAASADSASEQAHVYWDIGRCYETLGEKEPALENYRKAVEKARSSKWGELAESRIGGLTSAAKPVAAAKPGEVTTTTVAAKPASEPLKPAHKPAPAPTATIRINPAVPLVAPTTLQAKPIVPAPPTTLQAKPVTPAPPTTLQAKPAAAPAKTDSKPKTGN